MPAPVVDTMVLQAFLFGHPQGGEILLQGLGVDEVRYPAEIYRGDEDERPLTDNDDGLSEFARGIRYARRKIQFAPAAEAARYGSWLGNLQQLHPLRLQGMFRLDPLEIEEVPRRLGLEHRFGIGVGEAAGIVLAMREEETPAVFASSDERACEAATELGAPFMTIPQALLYWIRKTRPNRELLEGLLEGMTKARFAMAKADERTLFRELESGKD